jgi:hypothetical protein
MERITIQFSNWEKYNPRKDYINPTWFALSNSILSDPDFIDYSPLEFKALIYLFCEASKKRFQPFEVSFKHAAKLFDISEKTLSTVIENLQQRGTLTVIRTSSVRDPNVIRQLQTDIQTDRHTSVVDELFKIWNEHSGTLAKVTSLTKSRRAHANARLKEQGSLEVWKQAIERVAKSDFCNGINDRSWKATFDFLIKPDTLTKILEGTYDNRKANVNAPRFNGKPEPKPVSYPDAAKRAELDREFEERNEREAALIPVSEESKRKAEELLKSIGIKKPQGAA